MNYSEVGDFNQCVFGDQDILRFDVPVNNAFRMGEFHAMTELNRHGENGAKISTAAGLDPSAQVPAIDIFDKQVGDFINQLNKEAGGDIRVHAHPYPAIRFGNYSFRSFLVSEDLRARDLDGNRDIPAQMLGNINFSHGSAENLFDFVSLKNNVARMPLSFFRQGRGLRVQLIGRIGRFESIEEASQHDEKKLIKAESRSSDGDNVARSKGIFIGYLAVIDEGPCPGSLRDQNI